jgi:phosphoglycerate dehydrogenase-like enzyme
MKVVFWGKEFLRLKEALDGAFADHDILIADPADDKGALADAEMLVVRPVTVDDGLLSRAPALKLVQQWGAGAEGIDLEACARRGVYACNVPSIGTGNAEGVAEVAFLHMLLLAKRFFRAREKLLEGKVYTPPGIALWGKKACVIGLGNVGRSITVRMKAFGMKVTGVNRTLPADHALWGIDTFVPLTDAEKAVKGAKFVVTALALTQETENIIGEPLFRAMDRDAFFINVARGGIVSRQALERALGEEWIAGAGLDVLWEEPHRTDDPFLAHPKVVVTPHIGGVNDASLEGVLRFIAGNAALLGEGKPPRSWLNEREMERKTS